MSSFDGAPWPLPRPFFGTSWLKLRFVGFLRKTLLFCILVSKRSVSFSSRSFSRNSTVVWFLRILSRFFYFCASFSFWSSSRSRFSSFFFSYCFSFYLSNSVSLSWKSCCSFSLFSRTFIWRWFRLAMFRIRFWRRSSWWLLAVPGRYWFPVSRRMNT